MPEKYELKPLSDISFDMKLVWIGVLKQILGMPKKQLRRVFRVIENPKLEAKIQEKDKQAKRTFIYGFRSFIKKEEKKERQILAPHPEVQEFLKAVKRWLERVSAPHQNAFGFVKKRNPKKAVQALLKNERFPLLRNKHFFRFDVRDAFPSITIEMVMALLRSLGIQEAIVEVLAWQVTYYYQNERRLPQGSSCSPIILNLVYRPMCEEIDGICKKHDINWIVYADDFNFASLDIPQEVKNELLAVPPKYGFQIKPEKTKDNLGKTIPHVLGLTVVAAKIHIKRRTKKKFRRILYAAIKFGVYSPEHVAGIASGVIKQVYSEQKNWPGWLLKPYQQYQEKGILRPGGLRNTEGGVK